MTGVAGAMLYCWRDALHRVSYPKGFAFIIIQLKTNSIHISDTPSYYSPKSTFSPTFTICELITEAILSGTPGP